MVRINKGTIDKSLLQGLALLLKLKMWQFRNWFCHFKHYQRGPNRKHQKFRISGQGAEQLPSVPC